jgi:hypothetical protein|tara:strand:+ start:17 stop:529 length:513 start_codon:yes stop_codon:yes gene_type:complete
MQIEVYEIEEPKAPNVEQGWAGRKTYKVTDRDMNMYYANPDNVQGISQLKVGDKLDIKFTEKVYSGKPIKFLNSFTPINHMTATNNVSTPQPVQEGTAGGHDVAELVGRDWSIILQACVNRFVAWTPDQKLQWFLLNYSRGSTGAFKHLQQVEDSDNTTISAMPDDKIPF